VESVGVPERAFVRSSSAHRGDGTDDRWSRRALITSGSIGVAAVMAILIGWLPGPATLTIAAMVPAAGIDARSRRLPDPWIGAAATVLATTLASSWALGGRPEPVSILAGAAAVTTPLLALHLISPRSMGFGDVKAALVLGAALGTVTWQLGVVALCAASGLGAAVGLARRSATIAFGPFLVLGAAVALVGSELGLAVVAEGSGT
jgi:leader peptidase (prepilin peptidase)/N-methyltransferase